MGWEDRPYYRDQSGASTNPVMRLMTGSVPLFTVVGVRVRAHAQLLLLIGLVLLLDQKQNYPLTLRAFTMAILVVVILLHEFGHVFAARAVGGSSEEVMLTPMGGLAMTDRPRRAGAAFLTVAGGPAVNLLICFVCAIAVGALSGYAVHLNPFRQFPPQAINSFHAPAFYFWWVFVFSYWLILFNMLPIYPLDGGQMLQATLWPGLGYHRSMMVATTLGMTSSVAAGLWMLYQGEWWLTAIMAMLFYSCFRQRAALRETGPEDWQDSIDYSSSIYGKDEPPKRRRVSRRAIARARRIAQQERDERNRIDSILAKVSASGIGSLTWFERRVLRKATERQRRRELEFSDSGKLP